MEKLKKNQVIKIYYICSYIGFDYSGKQNDKSIISLMNISFQSEKNEGRDIPEESMINPYLTKEYVPELEIIDKNTIKCDKEKYEIKNYFKEINKSSNEFLDEL